MPPTVGSMIIRGMSTLVQFLWTMSSTTQLASRLLTVAQILGYNVH